MLVLFETAAGYALFKVADEGKIRNADSVWELFTSPEVAQKNVALKSFSKFQNTVDALSAASSLVEGKVNKSLKSFLKEHSSQKDLIAVTDSKLATSIKEDCKRKCVCDNAVNELTRGIRSQLSALISDISEGDMKAMTLGLSHSLSRYKLKFSPDKVDTMIVQAVGLLDDLDKELNTYAMRVREWFGWHFPELSKIITDNVLFSKIVKKMGVRSNASKTDFSDILPEELAEEVQIAAELSMGTEISEEDIENIQVLCDQVLDIGEYRAQLYEYLKNRMEAIAPNLTALVGELVGARLIAHAGSLLNLAKHPASTVQILGAEKALFRALKSKHPTPKYGLLYHASLVGQASQKNKGKVSRILAAKAALSCRVDALGDKNSPLIGIENRAKLENYLRVLENKPLLAKKMSTGGFTPSKHDHKRTSDGAINRNSSTYNPSTDIAMKTEDAPTIESKKPKKKSVSQTPISADEPTKKKKKSTPVSTEEPTKKKKKKSIIPSTPTALVSAQEPPKKKSVTPVSAEEPTKKKKKKSTGTSTPASEDAIGKKRKRDTQGTTEKKKKKKKPVE